MGSREIPQFPNTDNDSYQCGVRNVNFLKYVKFATGDLHKILKDGNKRLNVA